MFRTFCLQHVDMSEKIGGPERSEKVQKAGRINFHPMSLILDFMVPSHDAKIENVHDY